MDRSSIAPVGRRSNEALASLFGLSGVFCSRATSRSPPNARTVTALGLRRVSPHECAPASDYRSFSTAIPGKLFRRAGVLGIIPHLQLMRCARSTHARRAACFTYEPGRRNNFPVIFTLVLT